MAAQNTGRTPIGDVELFDGLAPEEIEVLETAVLLRQYVAGETIFRVGDNARALLIVSSGVVGLTIPVPIRGNVDDVVLEEKSAGSVIAWSALVPPNRYTLGALARTDVELHCFERNTLTAIFESFPRLHCNVMQNLNRVIASRVALLEALVARDLRRWVAEKCA